MGKPVAEVGHYFARFMPVISSCIALGISPAKLQKAAASIDRIGEEAKVIPATFVIALIITGVCAVMALFWAF